MFDPHWMEEMTVDALYGAGILVAAAVVLVGIGVAIGSGRTRRSVRYHFGPLALVFRDRSDRGAR